MRDFRKIIAWQMADNIVVSIYNETRLFPKEEMYSLTSQIRRSAYSVPANIAEGASRSSKKDYLHFLYIARGSLAELSYFIHLSQRLNYLGKEQSIPLLASADEVSRTLAGLIQSVEKEAGLIRRTAANITASLVLFLASSVFGLRSSVCGL